MLKFTFSLKLSECSRKVYYVNASAIFLWKWQGLKSFAYLMIVKLLFILKFRVNKVTSVFVNCFIFICGNGFFKKKRRKY